MLITILAYESIPRWYKFVLLHLVKLHTALICINLSPSLVFLIGMQEYNQLLWNLDVPEVNVLRERFFALESDDSSG